MTDDARWEQVHRERVRLQTQLDRLAGRVEELERVMQTIVQTSHDPAVFMAMAENHAPTPPPAPAPDEADEYALNELWNIIRERMRGNVRPRTTEDGESFAEEVVAKAIALGLAGPAPRRCRSRGVRRVCAAELPRRRRTSSMSSNELIDIMREFGVEVRMLGTDEEPSPNGVALADMLTEIHRLRNLTPAPADRVVKPDVEDVAETIAQWRDILGSEGVARKVIERHWTRAGADTPGEGE